ncbi:MAG: polyphosphate kinase 2 [Vicinamibacterales bacterium]
MEEMTRRDYERHLEPLQQDLNDLVHWLAQRQKRLLVIFEGRDAAGKGGVINAIMRRLNPRQARVVALGKPTEREQGQWYFQRYVEHLPTAGELVLMDRSWYNRAGVERVMGFCSDGEYRRFLRATPVFEKLLADDGLMIRKYWLAVDQRQQEARFAERAADPLKHWKLSPIDLKARQHYRDYGAARDTMFEATHRRFAPWTVVNFDDQRRGRLNLIRHLLRHVPYDQLEDSPIVLPPLRSKVRRERFSGPVKPIAGWY